jgi:hypothetical protein
VAAVAGSGVVLAEIGAVVGIALSIPSVQVIESFLYTVRPGDARTYLAVGGLLLFVACVSSVAASTAALPARSGTGTARLEAVARHGGRSRCAA